MLEKTSMALQLQLIFSEKQYFVNERSSEGIMTMPTRFHET